MYVGLYFFSIFRLYNGMGTFYIFIFFKSTSAADTSKTVILVLKCFEIEYFCFVCFIGALCKVNNISDIYVTARSCTGTCS